MIKIRTDHVQKLSDVWHALDQFVTHHGKDFNNMYMTTFLQYLIGKDWELRAAFIDNWWAEVACEEDLNVAHRFFDTSNF